MKKLKLLLLFLLMVGGSLGVQAQLSEEKKAKLGELVREQDYTGGADNMNIGTRTPVFTLCGATASQVFRLFETPGLRYTVNVTRRTGDISILMYYNSTTDGSSSTTHYQGNLPLSTVGTNGSFTTTCGLNGNAHWHRSTLIVASGQGEIEITISTSNSGATASNYANTPTVLTVTLDPVENVYVDSIFATIPKQTTYANGSAFPAISLLTSVGERSTVTWAATAATASLGQVSLPEGFSIKDSLGMNAYIPAIPSIYNPYDEDMSITLTAKLTGCPTNLTVDTSYVFLIKAEEIEDNTLIASSDKLVDAVCGIKDFSTFTFSTSKEGIRLTSGVSYVAAFVSGTDILDLENNQPDSSAGTGTWTPKTVRTGSGVYQVTPKYKNLRGVPVVISLEAGEPLSSDMVNASGNLAYENGDIVPSIDLGAHVPTGAVLTWTATGDAIGLPTSGNMVVPSFKAVNTTDTVRKTTISYTLKYTSGACAGTGDITGNITISVAPKIINNPSLNVVMSASSVTVCEGADFDEITLNARYHEVDEFLDNNEVKYYIAYLSGDHVLNGSAGYITSPWEPEAGSTGTGVYQITPFHNNNQGAPATVTFTVLPKLEASQLVNAQGSLTYENDDIVPAINIGANLPAGVKINWTVDDPLFADSIGMATSGAGVVPSFKATNTTNHPITVMVTYTLAYINTDCDFKNDAEGYFTITVLPKTIANEDLTVSVDLTVQAKCETFDEITFSPTYKGSPIEGVTYVVEFVSGDNIISNAGTITGNAWTPDAGKPGVGIYRITPFYNNMKGVGQTIQLGLLPKINVANVNYAGQALSYMNGERVEELVFRGLPEGIVYRWTATGAGTIGSSSTGVASVPSFIARNTTDEPIKITYNFSVASNDFCHLDGDSDSSFSITVYPTPTISGLKDMVYCNGANFVNIGLTSSLTQYYKLSFVSGTDFGLELENGTAVVCSTALANSTSRTLAGTYAVTAYDNVTHIAGEVSYFTVKVRPSLFVVEPEDIVTVNGSTVPAYNFVGSTEAFFVWQRTGGGNESLLPEWGKGYQFPSFTAVNNTGVSVEYTYNVWAVMENEAAFVSPSNIVNMCTSAMASFKITIQPSPNIAGLESNEYCNEQEIKIGLPALQDADKRYQLDFYNGTNLGLEIVASATGDTVTTTDGFVHNPYNRTLVGTYALTVFDINDPSDKVITYFTVTVYPTPNIDKLKEIVTVNGAVVPDYLFTGNVQDGIYKWTLTEAPAGVTHNLPQFGDGNRFPSFTAQNNTGNVHTYKYAVSAFSQKSGNCDEVSDTLIITIYPTPTIAALEDVEYCHGAEIGISLETSDNDYYELAFVSGTDLSLALDSDGLSIIGEAENNTNKIISGVYSLTSRNIATGTIGKTVHFVVTIYPVPTLDEPKSLITVNGAYVPSFEFTGNIEGGKYSWELTTGSDAAENTMPVKGENNVFPAFVAENHTSDAIEYTYTVTATSGSNCEPIEEEFTITIYPTPTIAALEDVEYCHGAEIDIELPELVDYNYYELAFVSGTNLNLVYDGTIIGEASNETNQAISGTYSLTARNNETHIAGETVHFVVTIYPEPALDEPKSLITVNGAYVPSFEFTGNIEGGKYSWELTSGPRSVENTMPIKGENNVFPAFVAENHTSDAIEYTYTVTATSGSDCEPIEEEFTITIYPTPTIAALEDVEYCHGAEIRISLEGSDNDYYELAFVSGTDLSLALDSDGLSITGDAENITNKAISGVYSLTSRNIKTGAIGETVHFVVTVYPELMAEDIIFEDKTYSNGERVPERCFSSSFEGVEYVWTLVSNEVIGSNASGRNCIPEFIAVNTTKEPITATYEVAMTIGGCKSEDVKTVTITVVPNIVDTDNLYATVSKAEQTICFNDEFEAIDLLLKHRTTSNLEGNVIFEWTLQGNDVIGMGAYGRFETEGVDYYTWEFNVSEFEPEAGTGIYTVTPIWNNLKGAPISFTLIREANPTIKDIQDVIVCNNSSLSVNFESTTATKFRWEVEGGSQLGIPNTGMNTVLNVAHLINNTEDVITETISVTSINTNGCEGDYAEFTVTVLPNVQVEQIGTIFEGFGVNVPEIEFTGIATEYRWTSSNPLISTNPAAITSGIGNFPAFTTTIVETTPVVNVVTVTPVYDYEGLKTCTGEAMQFAIIVAPEPVIEHIDDIEVCEGGRVPVTNFSLLNANSNYKITYEFSEYVGLDNDSTRRAIPSYEAVYTGDGFEKQVSTVTVTPRFELGDIKYQGQPISFNVTVYPQLVLEDLSSVVTNICHGTSIELKVLIEAGYEPTIQWYKDGVAIPGAEGQDSVYYATESGLYYAVVSSRCGEVTGANHKIDLSYDVIRQRWNDVLTINLETSNNGGHTFTDIKWYKVGDETVLGTFSNIGNVSVGESYYFTANGGSFVSCEYTVVERETARFSVAPNPVKAGDYVKVTGATGTIYVINAQGSVVSSVVVTNEVAEIKMPKTKGIYVIYVVADNGETEGVNVIVK